ncbi:amt1 [Symbiodinium natans]|uniref:Ammonium transporter n=1 Tax=Symbiodinium natans TaxID=878477 RepID=A0A812RFU9_9DINO|nr:amt1 [Symbiodinium natans]
MVVEVASTAWMLVAMALVQLMTPGLAFFYGGLVKETSVLTMMMQNYASMGAASIIWFAFGFSMCFGDSWGFIGSPWTYLGFRHLSVREALPGQVIPSELFAAYQGMFAIITPALMTGAFADRLRFKPYLIFMCLWLVLVYFPWCHLIWGGGWLAQWGVVDFAGGIVVHVTAGFSALASLSVIGHREIPEDEKHIHETPHNIPFVALGTALLWFGWFGFNGGSAVAANGVAIGAAVNSQIAASVALFLWLIIEWLRFGRPSLVGLCVGAIAGFATITPAAGYLQPWAAFVLGLIATVFCYACTELINRLGLDDALDVWGVHGMGGFIGAIMLGTLADGSECADEATAPKFCINPGTVTASLSQTGKQTAAVLMCAVYSVVVTLIILKGISLCMPLNPPSLHVDLHELAEHEKAYHSPTRAYLTDVLMAVQSSQSQSKGSQSADESSASESA